MCFCIMLILLVDHHKFWSNLPNHGLSTVVSVLNMSCVDMDILKKQHIYNMAIVSYLDFVKASRQEKQVI